MSIIDVLKKEGNDPGLVKLDTESKVIQAELEGIFRQLLQGASQLHLVAGFDVYNALFQSAVEKFDKLQEIIGEADFVKQQNPGELN